MTVIADAKKRVVLPPAKPGDRFDLAVNEGKYVLTRLEPVKEQRNKVKLVRCKQGYLVAVSERPITQEMTRRYLDEFP
jgi:exosome complex RNA-binding protein Csl4